MQSNACTAKNLLYCKGKYRKETYVLQRNLCIAKKRMCFKEIYLLPRDVCIAKNCTYSTSMPCTHLSTLQRWSQLPKWTPGGGQHKISVARPAAMGYEKYLVYEFQLLHSFLHLASNSIITSRTQTTQRHTIYFLYLSTAARQHATGIGVDRQPKLRAIRRGQVSTNKHECCNLLCNSHGP